jgi:hypothetical protein
MYVEEHELKAGSWTREDLVQVGRMLDRTLAHLEGRTVSIALAERLLFVRTRDGRTSPLRANAVQQLFEQRRGQQHRDDFAEQPRVR